MTIPFSNIIRADRLRNKEKYGNIETLATSIKTYGSIEPVILSKRPDGKYDLIAGDRRMTAMESIGISELHHNEVLQPGKGAFVFQSEVPQDLRLELELEENLHRLDMDWVDQVLAIARIHKTKQDTNPNWGQTQTGALFGFSHYKVSYSLSIAKLLLKGDKELEKASSIREALAILTKRKEEAANAEMTRRMTKTITKEQNLGAFLDVIHTGTVPAAPADNDLSAMVQNILAEANGTPLPTVVSASPVPSLAAPSPSPVPANAPPIQIPLSSMFIYGNSLADDVPEHTKPEDVPSFNKSIMAKMPDAFVDHIVTDIPYGIDMDNLTLKNIADVAPEHEVQANKDQIPAFLEQAFRIVKPGGFCAFFFDLDHWNFIQQVAQDIGWRLQNWPNIACKTSPCQNNAAGFNFTKNYEVWAVMRKDEKTTLRKPQTTSWKSYNFAIERKLYNNPFAKPLELWKDVLDAIAFPGQTIYDPFAGEGSSLRAAAICGYRPFGSEITKIHYDRGLQILRDTFATIYNNNVEFA